MKLALGFLVLFEIADGVLTNLLIKGGIAHEGNPFMRPLAGSNALLAVKIAGVSLCVFILWKMYRRSPGLARLSAAFLTVLCALVVLWNLGLLATA